jgi:hypothetical protein
MGGSEPASPISAASPAAAAGSAAAQPSPGPATPRSEAAPELLPPLVALDSPRHTSEEEGAGGCAVAGPGAGSRAGSWAPEPAAPPTLARRWRSPCTRLHAPARAEPHAPLPPPPPLPAGAPALVVEAQAPPPGEDIDAEVLMSALETNGFHFSDVPLGSCFYIKVGGWCGVGGGGGGGVWQGVGQGVWV